MTEKKQITPAQAEARRKNGAKSKGRKTAEGKAMSRMNALKHAGYANVIFIPECGPLREDPEEAEAFFDAVIDALGPDGHPILFQQAKKIAYLLWRIERGERWGAQLLNADRKSSELKAQQLETYSWRTQHAADVLRRFDDPALTLEELFGTFIWVTDSPWVTEERQRPVSENPTAAEIRQVLHSLIEDFFGDVGDAADAMQQHAAEASAMVIELRTEGRRLLIEDLLDGNRLHSLERAEGYVSRELDRSMNRYLKLRETLLGAAFPPQDDSRNEPTDPVEDDG